MGLISYVFNITQQVLRLLNMPPITPWIQMAIKVDIPRAETAGIIKEYDTMNNSLVAKQADVILLSYPVGYIPDLTESLKSLEWVS